MCKNVIYISTSSLLGQWLNFKLFGITYLVGKIKFQLFFRVHWLSELQYMKYIFKLAIFHGELCRYAVSLADGSQDSRPLSRGGSLRAEAMVDGGD